MRPLLSTRLLFATCCGADALRHARDAGFPSLELRSDSVGDLLAPGQAERLARELAAEGTRAAWLAIGEDVTVTLGDPAALLRFGDALARLRLDGVTVAGPLRNVDVNELLAQTELSGARLCIERESFTAAEIRRWPRATDLGWDLAAASSSRPEDLDRFLGEVPAGRLLTVRVSARDSAGRRIPPGEHEAILLDEVWRRLRPAYVVYDVEDPSGFCASTCLDDVLARLRSFHAGELHPHAPKPWGPLGSSLAPG